LNNVTPQQQGAQYGSATSSVEYVLTQALRTNLKFDAAPKTVQFNYQLLNFTAPGMRGFVLYRVYNSAQGSAYIMRLAVGSAVPTDHTLAVAGTVATSISCRQQLRPPPPPQPTTYQSGAKPADTASSTKCQIWSPNCDDSDFAGSYNAQLGTGYVHSNSCTNYVVDPDTDKWENGPDGPGYYIDVGNNNVEKLQPGRCDD
jgi:hypothetical protein